MVNALWMFSVVPVIVTILSGHEPSDMLILAPLWKHLQSKDIKKTKEAIFKIAK